MGIEINEQMNIWCERHQQPYLDAKANHAFVIMAMLSAHFSAIGERMPEGVTQEESEKHFAEAIHAYGNLPVCCCLTDEKHEEILGAAMQTTGDSDEDEAEAMAEHPHIKKL